MRTDTQITIFDLTTFVSPQQLLTWSELAVFGQLVYALFQENGDNDVVIGHLAVSAERVGGQEEDEVASKRRRRFSIFWIGGGQNTKKNKSISGGKWKGAEWESENEGRGLRGMSIAVMLQWNCCKEQWGIFFLVVCLFSGSLTSKSVWEWESSLRSRPACSRHSCLYPHPSLQGGRLQRSGGGFKQMCVSFQTFIWPKRFDCKLRWTFSTF